MVISNAKMIIILGLLAVLILSGQVNGKEFRYDYQKNIDIGEKARLEISNEYGNITVNAEPARRITINAVKHVRAVDQTEAENVAEHIEINANKRGDLVTLKVRYINLSGQGGSFWDKLLGTGEDSFGSVDFDIIVPIDCQVEIDNKSGTVTVSKITGKIKIIGSSEVITLSDIEGDIEISAISGNIGINNVSGSIDISSGGADINLIAINGNIDIHSTSGKKTGTDLAGVVSISQTSGKVELKNLEGDLRLKSTSGSVDVEQRSGAVDITTYTGHVTIKSDFYTDKDSYIETSSGNVVFEIPEMSTGSVKFETISGDINADVPMAIKSLSKSKLVGDLGGNGSRISVVTSTGNITLKQF